MNENPVQRISRLEIVLAFMFGCFALAAVLWLAFGNVSLTHEQFEILRIVLALAGGGVGAVIPGLLDLRMQTSSKVALRAGGALAVFVVLYFWSPAHWDRPAAAIQQKTDGNGSPAQNGNGNIVINNQQNSNGVPAR